MKEMRKGKRTGKLDSVDETWVPKVVDELNGQYVKVVKFVGQYVWHSHADEDELFWVLQGRVLIHLRDRTVELRPGEFFVVPRGVEHKPGSPVRSPVVRFEPASTPTQGGGGLERPATIPHRR